MGNKNANKLFAVSWAMLFFFNAWLWIASIRCVSKTPPSCSHGSKSWGMKQFSVNLEGPKTTRKNRVCEESCFGVPFVERFSIHDHFLGLKINGVCSTTCFLEMFYTGGRLGWEWRSSSRWDVPAVGHQRRWHCYAIRVAAEQNANQKQTRIEIQNCMLNSAFCSTGGVPRIAELGPRRTLKELQWFQVFHKSVENRIFRGKCLKLEAERMPKTSVKHSVKNVLARAKPKEGCPVIVGFNPIGFVFCFTSMKDQIFGRNVMVSIILCIVSWQKPFRKNKFHMKVIYRLGLD